MSERERFERFVMGSFPYSPAHHLFKRYPTKEDEYLRPSIQREYEVWQAAESRGLERAAAHVERLREALADLLRGCEEIEDAAEDWPRYLRAKDNARALLGEGSDE
jgi:hypothetical protein